MKKNNKNLNIRLPLSMLEIWHEFVKKSNYGSTSQMVRAVINEKIKNTTPINTLDLLKRIESLEKLLSTLLDKKK